jgi:predicted transglutaminase-like cysteine proteinase
MSQDDFTLSHLRSGALRFLAAHRFVIGLLLLMTIMSGGLVVSWIWRPVGIELAPEAAPNVAPMLTGESVKPPPGFILFCLNNLDECRGALGQPQVVILTDALRNQLSDVQWSLNNSIAPRENPQHLWIYPVDGGGDCNTYTMAKRKALIGLGWPSSSLLMAAAWTETREAHLVLVVRTNAGDLVLDNRTPAVVDWKSLPYQWIERQTGQNPAIWVKIDDRSTAMSNTVTLDRAASLR